MPKYFVYIFSLFFFTSCNSGSRNQDGSMTGKQIFKSNCVSCHGIKGDLMTNGARNLKESNLSLEERILIIRDGRNIMTSFREKLSKEQIRKVAEHTMTLRDSIPPDGK
ncbi:MAG: c-type cytochrome [Saprospiraceae bacterium]|mgnify:FL=1|nr:c-type cytochrome [Candidatus Vicinibacter proximus]MCC6843382.1 c-type cytochrome [Saprospiraceae bacterium]